MNFIGYDGKRHQLCEIFEFTNDDSNFCGAHDCGYITDGSCFIESFIVPLDWEIRRAPQQLPKSSFVRIMNMAKNLKPLPEDGYHIHTYYPSVICFDDIDIYLDNKYIKMAEHFGCSIKYQDNISPLIIDKSCVTIGAVMPVKFLVSK